MQASKCHTSIIAQTRIIHPLLIPLGMCRADIRVCHLWSAATIQHKVRIFSTFIRPNPTVWSSWSRNHTGLKNDSFFPAYNLADGGLDVWMGNARGNSKSRKHINLDPDHNTQRHEFFDFTFEEIGIHDLAAMIDYVLNCTQSSQLHYIGHSQGGTAFLVLTSLKPEYNSKITSVHLLAGVGYQRYFPNEMLAELAVNVDSVYVSHFILFNNMWSKIFCTPFLRKFCERRIMKFGKVEVYVEKESRDLKKRNELWLNFDHRAKTGFWKYTSSKDFMWSTLLSFIKLVTATFRDNFAAFVEVSQLLQKQYLLGWNFSFIIFKKWI